MYKNAHYYDASKDVPFGTMIIKVEIDGILNYIPIDAMNGEYQRIMKLVEEGKLVIAPATN
jgi:hypothetical protein